MAKSPNQRRICESVSNPKVVPSSEEAIKDSDKATHLACNRSRLAQELLEQNSAILQKLKERTSETNPSSLSTEDPSGNSSSANFYPFPRQMVKQPKQVAIQLGMYGSVEKY